MARKKTEKEFVVRFTEVLQREAIVYAKDEAEAERLFHEGEFADADVIDCTFDGICDITEVGPESAAS